MAPMRLVVLAWMLGPCMLGCTGGDPEDKAPSITDSDGSQDTDPTPTPTPTPAPSSPHALPDDLFAALPKDNNDLPVLMAGSEDLGPGIQLALAYDADLSDPITHYGDCLAQVGRCYDGDLDALSTCVAAVPACASPEGGDGCCPTACIEAFVAEDALRPTDDAIDMTFVAGTCIEGFVAYRDAEGPSFEVSP